MALLDNPHAMYPYHLMNSRLAAAAGIGSTGNDLNSSQHINHMNGYMNGRFDMRIGSTNGPQSQSSSSNRSSTSPTPMSRHNIDTIHEDDSSPTHQTVLNATMSLKLESAAGYHHHQHRVGHFGHNRPTTFRPFSAESPDIDNNLNEENLRRDLKVMTASISFYIPFIITNVC